MASAFIYDNLDLLNGTLTDGTFATNDSIGPIATIAFVQNDPAADTITDSGNGFVVAGFVSGMVIDVSGSTLNDGTYTIDAVVAGTITLIADDILINEAAGANVTIYSIAGDFVAGAALTNEERSIDQNTGLAVSAWAQNDILRIDLGTSPGTPDRFAILFNADEADSLKVYAGDHATSFETGDSPLILTYTTDFVEDTWTVSAFNTSPGDVRYYFIHATSAGGLVGLVELIIGKLYTFGTEPDIEGFVFDKISNADLSRPYSREYEFSNKRGELRRHWRWNWSNIGETMKDNLITFRDAVEISHKKFLYYSDLDSEWYWVRMTSASLKFERVAYQIYNTTMEMYEQLK